jgi:hypothetical protein
VERRANKTDARRISEDEVVDEMYVTREVKRSLYMK